MSEPDLDARAAAMVNAFASIDATKKDQGEIPCPVCGAPLHFARAGKKRHVRAACSTRGCLQFMS